MAHQSPLLQNCEAGEHHTRRPEPSYAVGYGKPPVHTRFKPGQSGNPRGKRKGLRNARTVVEEVMNQRITVHEGARTRSLTKLDAMVLRMMSDALKGDSKAQGSLIGLLRSLGILGEVPEPTSQKPFTADDEGLLADFLKRHASEAQQADQPNDQSTHAETEGETKA